MGSDKVKAFQEIGRSRLAGRMPMRNVAMLAFAAVFVSGCASVPDALNPAEWYKDTRDFITGNDDARAAQEPVSGEGLAAERGTPPPGSDEPIPDLDSVPERPRTSTAEERREIRRGLVSDRNEDRRYSSELIQRQAPADAPLAPPAPAQTAAPSPSPSGDGEGIAIDPARQEPQPPMQSAPPQVQESPQPPSGDPPAQPAQDAQDAQDEEAARPPSEPPAAPPAPPPSSTETPSAAQEPDREDNGSDAGRQAATGTTGPRPPALAPVPSPVFGQDEDIVVVSGEGVQTIPSLESAAYARRNEGDEPGSGSGRTASDAVSGVRPLEEFNPTMARGSYQVANILFANNSAALGSRERSILREVAKQHGQVGGTIRVVGHASQRTKTLEPIKHKMVNFEVSAARAEAVARELIRLGVQPEALFVGAVADREPRYREYMPSGEAGNRRTEIFIDY